MGLTLKTSGDDKPREIPPADVHRAICCGVIDLGTQTIDFKQGKGPEQIARIMLMWELSDEPSEADGKPLLISEEFTASLHEKSTLRGFLTAWRGKPFTAEELAGFNPSVLLGQPCQLSVIHQESKTGKTFAKVKSATRLGKGQSAPEPVHDQIAYEVEDGYPPSNLPEWIRKKIDASAERQARTQSIPDLAGAGMVSGPVDERTPF